MATTPWKRCHRRRPRSPRTAIDECVPLDFARHDRRQPPAEERCNRRRIRDSRRRWGRVRWLDRRRSGATTGQHKASVREHGLQEPVLCRGKIKISQRLPASCRQQRTPLELYVGMRLTPYFCQRVSLARKMTREKNHDGTKILLNLSVLVYEQDAPLRSSSPRAFSTCEESKADIAGGEIAHVGKRGGGETGRKGSNAYLAFDGSARRSSLK